MQEITAGYVRLKTGERIDTGLTLCAIGTAPVALVKKFGTPLQHGRLKTDPDMRVTGRQVEDRPGHACDGHSQRVGVW